MDLVTETGLPDHVKPYVEKEAIRVAWSDAAFADIPKSCEKLIRYTEGRSKKQVFETISGWTPSC